jgi:hypothetical protein
MFNDLFEPPEETLMDREKISFLIQQRSPLSFHSHRSNPDFVYFCALKKSYFI